MKAIILASGIGKRLKPITDEKPKCLVKINEKSILEYQLDSLYRSNIKNVAITTGPFEEQIKNLLKKNYQHMNVILVKNPKYNSTNYIYSLWLTKEFIDEDIILIHGDLIFDYVLLKKIHDKKENGVLVNKTITPPKKDFKAFVKETYVRKIGVNLFGKNAFFCLPLYKFSKKDFLVWMDEIEKEINHGNVNIYAEDALNNILDKILLYPVYYSEEFCMEIDTLEDLKKARNYDL